MKKKAIKIAASTAVAASAFVAAAPVQQADAATNVTQLVTDAQNAGTVLKWAISVEGTANFVDRPYVQYNAAKKAIAAAEAAAKGASTSEQLSISAKLVEPKLQVKRAEAYIDALTSSEKIIGLTKELVAAKAGKNLDTIATTYHKASAEYKKQGALLDRVYGESTRKEIREKVKPAFEAIKADLTNDVTVHMHLANAAKLTKENKVEEASEELSKAIALFELEGVKFNFKDALKTNLDDVAKNLPLQVLTLARVDKNTVTVKFSKEVDPLLAAGQFTFDNSLVVQTATVAADKKTVTLTTSDQVAGKTYALAYQGVATGKSFITPANPGDANFAVDATDRARLEIGQTRTYTVTLKNIDKTPYVGSVNIDLFSKADRSAGVTDAVITSVNGTAVNLDTFDGVTSTDGKVTFTIAVPAGSASEYVVPVIEKDTNDDGTPLYAAGTFITAGGTDFYALAETADTVTGTVVADDYVDAANAYYYDSVLGKKFKWDENDKFYLKNVAITQAQFQTLLSEGDTFTVDYNEVKSNVSSWNIVSNITVDTTLEVTSPSKAISYDGITYRVTGKGEVGNIVELYKDNDGDGFYSAGDVYVGSGTVSSAGTWVINATNLTQGAENNLVVVQYGPKASAAALLGAGANPNVAAVPAIYEGPFAALTVIANFAVGGDATLLDRNDVLDFTFENTNPLEGFVVGKKGTVVIQDNFGKKATLSVEVTTINQLVIKSITAPSEFNNNPGASTSFFEIVSVSGIQNQDLLNFNVSESDDTEF